jgi:uncharacterized Zn finger protein
MAATAASDRFRVIYHEPICPDCGSFDIVAAEVTTTGEFTETALTCRACGTAWPLACVSDFTSPSPVRPGGGR